MDIESVGKRLRRFSPRIYRLAQPAWWIMKRALARKGYWNRRKGLAYYQAVLDLSRKHVPAGASVIDVGASNTRLVDQLTWFPCRIALDNAFVFPRRGVRRVRADFMEYRRASAFDLVLCLQVIEHQEDPRAFTRKLLATGRTVIISVPYRWPAGAVASHREDPVDEAKLRDWAGREPLESLIVNDARQRLVAVFRGDHPPPAASRQAVDSGCSAQRAAVPTAERVR